MIHVGIEVEVVLFELFFQLALHHAFARAGVMAVATDNLIDVLVILPVGLDLTRAKSFSDTVGMLESELRSSLNLLTV